jgi:hypothetical protein
MKDVLLNTIHESVDPLGRMKREVEHTFTLDFLRDKQTPLVVSKHEVSPFFKRSLANFLIKSNNEEEFQFDELQDESFQDMVKSSIQCMQKLNISMADRYCFATIRQGHVQRGETLSIPGWHIDGMQGDEVSKKMPADIQFVWTNSFPTTFANQSFDIEGLNPSEHNVFDWLGSQVDPSRTFTIEPYYLYAMNPYHVHQATPADRDGYRQFVRISYTFTPITSVTMTLNPSMHYNYLYHTTTGLIPKHLK